MSDESNIIDDLEWEIVRLKAEVMDKRMIISELRGGLIEIHAKMRQDPLIVTICTNLLHPATTR